MLVSVSASQTWRVTLAPHPIRRLRLGRFSRQSVKDVGLLQSVEGHHPGNQVHLTKVLGFGRVGCQCPDLLSTQHFTPGEMDHSRPEEWWGLLTSAPLKPLLVGTKTVNGPKFCRGHEREPERRGRGGEKEDRRRRGGEEGREEEEEKGGQEEDISNKRTLDILKIKVPLEEDRCCMKTTSEVLKPAITG